MVTKLYRTLRAQLSFRIVRPDLCSFDARSGCSEIVVIKMDAREFVVVSIKVEGLKIG